MQLISVDTIKSFFNDMDLEALVEELNAVTPYLQTIATQEEISNLIVSTEADSFDAVITALQSANSTGLTLHSRICINDISDDLASPVDKDLTEMVKALEIIAMYEMIGDNNYTGAAIENVAFIHANYFQEYVQEEAIENGWVADHVSDCVDWSAYAKKMEMQYGSVEIDCPNLLNENSSTFFYPK